MIRWNVLTLLKGQSVDTVGGIEHTVDQHAIHVEVRLHLVVGNVEHSLLHLSGIVEAVVGLEVEGSDG